MPRRNGNKHVTEIANLALDLVNVFSDLEIIYSPESRVSLRLGIHTGMMWHRLILVFHWLINGGMAFKKN